MTLRKMSMKVLSVFMSLVMIFSFCVPAVSAAGHDHDHGNTVEINYNEEKVREYLNTLIDLLLGKDAFFADYTVSENSFYLAIGDDTVYAAMLAAKLGLGEDQFVVMGWDEVDEETIAKADLITVGYSEKMISGVVADVLDGKDVVIDWSAFVGKDNAKYVDKVLDYVVDIAYAERNGEEFTVELPEKVVNYMADNYFHGNKDLVTRYFDKVASVIAADKWMEYVPTVPAKETARETVEAYLYGYVSFAKKYASLMRDIDAANKEATVVLLSNYNTFADLGLEVSFDDIVIDLGDYFTSARQDAVNDYVNNFLDKIFELKDEFLGAGEVDAVDFDYSDIPAGTLPPDFDIDDVPAGTLPPDFDIDDIPAGTLPEGGETATSSALKDYINENLRDYIESFTKEDGAIDKEALIKDVVKEHGSIGNYIEKIEDESGYTIEEWEDTLKDEISAELEKDTEFREKVEGEIAKDVQKELEEEFGADGYTEEQYQEKLKEKLSSSFDDKLNEMIKEEVDSKFEDYRQEIDAAVKVKDTYENSIKVYEEELYNLIVNLLEDARKAKGVLADVKSLVRTLKNKFGFEIDLMLKLADSIDPEIRDELEDEFGKITDNEKFDRIEELENKLVEKIEAKLLALGWIEEADLEVPTLELIYNNLDKLDAKTREWLESFDKGDVTMILGGLIVYSDKITVWTEKGLEQFNAIYDEIADTKITIDGTSIDIGELAAAPFSMLSLFYAGAMDNVVFVDVSKVETGLSAYEGKEVIKAYLDDTSLAFATEAGSSYIVEQICDALTVTCIHKDDDKDHKCDFCGEVLSECADTDNDHKCDYCGAVLTECVDADKDHKCDICGKVLSECADNDKDHKCDYCGAVLTECVDADKDHKCDICGKVLSECADNDNDHKCDYCGAVLSECSDAEGDGDHKCDICGKDGVSDHTFSEPDCITAAICSECGAIGDPALGHIEGEWVVEKEATRKEEGERVLYCARCGAEMNRETILWEGLSTLAIVLIVVACVVVAGGIGVAIFFIVKKNKKAKAAKTISNG